MTTPDYHLRAAVSADLPELCEFAAATFPMACPSYITEEDIAAHCAKYFTVPNMQKHLDKEDHHLHLAVAASGEIIGYILLIAGDGVDPEGYKQLHHFPALGIDKIYVSSELHGQGISRALMDWAEEKARAEGFESLWLATNPQNKRAIRFYEKSGFSIIGRREYYVGTTFNDDIVLEKPLVDTRNPVAAQ